MTHQPVELKALLSEQSKANLAHFCELYKIRIIIECHKLLAKQTEIDIVISFTFKKSY